ncbi:PP2C family protein-serine/threonine phosphatase [Streptomyces virginiae]|uniref:PP2C family protein-serine/threonine phosphatase n=1 Tax=Streptomyces virginiae TaxID=1961 RepID=UPI0022560014|nr:PP2C family protein-serine/threonine phosphatase [Streptomyces virginiae]MCX5276673.1 serine/threonine-protein phosphatase [Streptomyces virginiae]
MTTCQELAGFLSRNVCDAAAVDLLTEDGAPHRVATAGAVGLLTAGAGASPSVRASDGGHPLSEWATVAGGVPVHVLSVPLPDGDRVHGTVTAVRARVGFGDHEAATVHFTARLAAVHLRHARELAATEDTVSHLQRALVAEPGRPHPNLEVAGRYLPAGPRALVGGDWFETIRLHYGRTLLVVGDVMGHGLDAAVDMNAYRSTLRDVASTDLAPHRVLRRLDALAAEDAARRPATCLLVRVDPARGVAMFAGAGHLPPAVFGADGSASLVDLPVGPPLGTGVGGYEAVTRAITPQETLLMFTDGLVERRGEDIDVSLARLVGVRPPVGAGVDAVVDAVVAGLDARHAEDDVAVLAARARPRPPTDPGAVASGMPREAGEPTVER